MGLALHSTSAAFVGALAVGVLVSNPSSALNRRITPQGSCFEVDNEKKLVNSFGGTTYKGSYWAGWLECGIPDDSYFWHDDIRTLNLHFDMEVIDPETDTWAGAQPCLEQHNGDGYYRIPPGYRTNPDPGYQVVSWTGDDFSEWDDSTYSSWTPHLNIYLGYNDRLILIYTNSN